MLHHIPLRAVARLAVIIPCRRCSAATAHASIGIHEPTGPKSVSGLQGGSRVRGSDTAALTSRGAVVIYSRPGRTARLLQ